MSFAPFKATLSEVANPRIRSAKSLALVSPLLQVVQRQLPGFELSRAYLLDTGSDRKYVHFITRGHGTSFGNSHGAKTARPSQRQTPPQCGLKRPCIYQDHLSGMEIAGFGLGNTSLRCLGSESSGVAAARTGVGSGFKTRLCT